MNNRPWFRLYHEVLDDPKVQGLTPEMFRFWVNLLCLASRHNGEVPDLEHVAFSLRVSMEEADANLGALEGYHGLLDKIGTKLIPHNWNGRQFSSDSSTPRVQKHRKRFKETKAEHVGETKGNVRDTDTDTEQIQNRTEQDPPKSADSAVVPAKKKKSEPEPDPLADYPILKEFFVEMLGLLLLAHPKDKVTPKEGSAKWSLWRQELANLVRRDGHAEEDVRDCLLWTFTEEQPSSDGFCWKNQIRSIPALRTRKNPDAPIKFNMVFSSWQKSLEARKDDPMRTNAQWDRTRNRVTIL